MKNKYTYYEIEMHQYNGDIVYLYGRRPRKGTELIYGRCGILYKCKVMETPQVKENHAVCKVKVISEKMNTYKGSEYHG